MSSDYTATFTAVANFGQLKREAKQAEADLKDLRKQQAELNAQSMASAPKINQFSEALAKAANVSKTHRDATRDLSKAQTSLASATLGAEQAFKNAKKAQADYDKVTRDSHASTNQVAAAHTTLRRALIDSENASRRLERAVKDVDSAHTKATSSVHLFHNAMSKIGENQGPIAHLVNLTTKLEVLGAKFIAMGSMVSPAVAALSDFGGAAIALVGTLGPLGGSLAALPQLFSAVGQGAATAFLGFGGVMKAVGALNTAVVQAGANTEATAHQQMLAARAVGDASRGIRDASENAARTARDTAAQIQAANIQVRNSHESLQDAERGLIDTRREQIRALEDLETAVKREALAERSASLSVAEARANLQRAMLDPNATAFQKEEASVAFQEAENRQSDVRTTNTRQNQDLRTEQQRGGVDGTNAMIDARRSLRDANEAVTISERDYTNTIHDGAIAVRNAREAETRASLALNDALYAQAHVLDNVGTSAKNLKKIFAGLGPDAIQMAKDIFALKPVLEKLQDTAAKGLLPGVEKAIKNLTPMWDVLNGVIGKTAGAFGNFIAKASAHFTTPKWLDFLTRLGDSNVKVLDSLSDAFLNIADALAGITNAAMPFVEWFTKGLDLMTGKVADWVNGHGKELSNFFGPNGSLRKSLHGWGDVLGNVGSLLIDAFKAAMPFGMKLLDMLDRITAKWSTAMKPPKKPVMPKGANAAERQDYFDQMQGYEDSPFIKFANFLSGSLPTLQAAGHLIGVIADSWAQLTTAGQQSSPKILNALADQLIPALVKLLTTLGDNAPKLIDFFTQLTEVLGKLLSGESGGTFKVALNILDNLATLLNKLLDMKGIGGLVKDLFLLAAALKAISLVGKFTGISGALGGLISLPGRAGAARQGYRAGRGGEGYGEGFPVDITERQQSSYRRGRIAGRVRGWFGGRGGGGGGPSATQEELPFAAGDEQLGLFDSPAGQPKTRGRFRQWLSNRSLRSSSRGGGSEFGGEGGFVMGYGGGGGEVPDHVQTGGRWSRNRWTDGRSAPLHMETSRLATAGVSDEYDSMYASLMGGIQVPGEDEQTWAPSGKPSFRERLRGHFSRQSGRYKAIGKAIPSLTIAGVSSLTGAPVDIAAGSYEATEKVREARQEALQEAGREPRAPSRFGGVAATGASIAGAVLLQHYGEGFAEKLSRDPHAIQKAQKEFDSTGKELSEAQAKAAEANKRHEAAVTAVEKAQDAAAKAQAEYEQHLMDGTQNTKAGKEAAGKVATTQKRLTAAMETEAKTGEAAAEADTKVEEATAEHQAAGDELAQAKKEGNGGILGHKVNSTAVSLGMGVFGLAAPQIAGSLAMKTFHGLFSAREDEAGDLVKSRAGSVLSKVGGGIKNTLKKALGMGGAKDAVEGLEGDAKDAIEGKAEDAAQGLLGKAAGRVKEGAAKIAGHTKELVGKVADHGKELAGKFADHAKGMVTKVAGHMGTLVKGIGGAMKSISALMMSNPWILLVIALAVIVVLVIKHWDAIKHAVMVAIDWVWNFIKKRWPLILGILMGPFGLFLAFLIKHFDAVKQMFSDWIGSIWKVLKGEWAFISDLFMAPIRIFRALLTGDFGKIKDVFRGLVKDIGQIWDGIKGVFEAPVKFLINTVIEDGIIKNVNKVLDKLPGNLHIPDISWGGGGGASVASTKSARSIKAARGGLVPGYGNTDSVDADLMPGEFVIRKAAVKEIGVGNLMKMNDQHFSAGGVVKGILGGAGDIAKGAWDAGKGLANLAKDGAQWLAVKGIHGIRDAANATIDKIPGMKGLLANIAHGVNNKIFGGLEDFIQGGKGKGGGGSTAHAPGNLSGNTVLGKSMAASTYGWTGPQWDALYALWQQESGWNEFAGDPAHAYGIPQSLPGSKMASAGSDWMSNPATQIAWGLNYIRGAYKNPAAAWAHKAATDSRKGATGQYAQPGGWYANGGLVRAKVMPGEFVMNRDAVSKYGTSAMHRLNHADQFFAGGGFVSPTPIFAGGGTVRPLSARSATTTTPVHQGPLIGEVINQWAPEVSTGEALDRTMKKLAYLGVFGDD